MKTVDSIRFDAVHYEVTTEVPELDAGAKAMVNEVGRRFTEELLVGLNRFPVFPGLAVAGDPGEDR